MKAGKLLLAVMIGAVIAVVLVLIMKTSGAR